jgi:hypothetical protein
MKKLRFIHLLFVFVVVLSLLVACGTAATEAPTEAPTEEPMLLAHLSTPLRFCLFLQWMPISS